VVHYIVQAPRLLLSSAGVSLMFSAGGQLVFTGRQNYLYPGPRGFSWFFFLLRSGDHESRSGEKEKPLVTLDLNLTFMQTPAVKCVKLIITYQLLMVSTRMVESGITWPTWPGSTRVFARINVFICNDHEGSVLLNITTEHVSPHTHFVRRTRDFQIARHKLLVSAAQTGHWNGTVSQFADMRVHERLRGYTTRIVAWWGYE